MLENIISTFTTYEKKTYIDKEQVTKQLEEIIKNYIRRRDDPDETEEHMAEDIAYELEIFVDELKAIKPVDSNKHNCCDCDHYRGKVLGETYCNLYGCVVDSCDAWEEIEDR